MSASSLSIVVPVFNEGGNLRALIERLLCACLSMGRPFEIVFVDDGSTDDSPRILRAAVEAQPGWILAVLLDQNYGQHAALFAGFRQAHGEVIVTIDADLQNPPEEIPRLIAKVEEGFDVVGTIRRNRQDSAFRRVASGLMNRVSSAVCGVVMHDYGCMLRAYRRPIVEAMLQKARKRVFIPVLANYFAVNPCEIAVDHAARQAGESAYNLWRLMRLQFNLLMGQPRRVSVGMGERAGPHYMVKQVVGQSALV